MKLFKQISELKNSIYHKNNIFDNFKITKPILQTEIKWTQNHSNFNCKQLFGGALMFLFVIIFL